MAICRGIIGVLPPKRVRSCVDKEDGEDVNHDKLRWNPKTRVTAESSPKLLGKCQSLNCWLPSWPLDCIHATGTYTEPSVLGGSQIESGEIGADNVTENFIECHTYRDCQ